MKEFRVFKCNHCGKVAILLNNETIPTICCGDPMVELKANTTDAANEKHVPVAVREDGKIKVTVGSVEHPMTEEHSICWIALVTKNGYQMAYLNPGEKPYAEFADTEDAVEVYEYCNLHGLWKTVL